MGTNTRRTKCKQIVPSEGGEEGRGELFPVDQVVTVDPDLLASLKMADRVAMAQICARLANIFTRGEAAVGSAAVVDAVRLFGGKFSNNSRKAIALAAGIHPGMQLPAHLSPNRPAVNAARLSFSRSWAPLFKEAAAELCRLAEGES